MPSVDIQAFITNSSPETKDPTLKNTNVTGTSTQEDHTTNSNVNTHDDKLQIGTFIMDPTTTMSTIFRMARRLLLRAILLFCIMISCHC
jgi:hypothetical protein